MKTLGYIAFWYDGTVLENNYGQVLMWTKLEDAEKAIEDVGGTVKRVVRGQASRKGKI
jgi:hypothetical protein